MFPQKKIHKDEFTHETKLSIRIFLTYSYKGGGGLKDIWHNKWTSLLKQYAACQCVCTCLTSKPQFLCLKLTIGPWATLWRLVKVNECTLHDFIWYTGPICVFWLKYWYLSHFWFKLWYPSNFWLKFRILAIFGCNLSSIINFSRNFGWNNKFGYA